MTTHTISAHRIARRGVTLIELIIVFCLIGILTALAIPKVATIQYRADAAARSTRIALQMAQRLAITKQYDVIVSFDTANKRIRIVEDVNNNGIADAGERVTWRPLEEGMHFSTPSIGISGTVAGPVVGLNLTTINAMPSVIFHRSGSSSTNVEVYLTSPRTVGDDFRAVTSNQATGRTVMYRSNNGVWQAGTL